MDNKEFLKSVLKLKDDDLFIEKNEAINFFKRNNFVDFDIISDTLLQLIEYKNNKYYLSQNFGLIPFNILEQCRILLENKKELIIFNPKPKDMIISKFPIYIMNPTTLKGILVYIEDINLLKI